MFLMSSDPPIVTDLGIKLDLRNVEFFREKSIVVLSILSNWILTEQSDHFFDLPIFRQNALFHEFWRKNWLFLFPFFRQIAIFVLMSVINFDFFFVKTQLLFWIALSNLSILTENRFIYFVKTQFLFWFCLAIYIFERKN